MLSRKYVKQCYPVLRKHTSHLRFLLNSLNFFTDMINWKPKRKEDWFFSSKKWAANWNWRGILEDLTVITESGSNRRWIHRSEFCPSWRWRKVCESHSGLQRFRWSFDSGERHVGPEKAINIQPVFFLW